MAYTKIYMTNGFEIKKAPVGFSWTTFLFGGWPAIFRQDWMWGIGLLIACLLTYGIAGIVFAFFYNKLYIKNLFKQGYVVKEFGGMTESQLAHYLGYVKLPGSTEQTVSQ